MCKSWSLALSCVPAVDDGRQGAPSEARVLSGLRHTPRHRPTVQDTQNWHENTAESGL